MMARTMVDRAAKSKRPILSVNTIFIICCMLFSGALFAQDAPEVNVEKAAAETVAVAQDALEVVTDAATDAATEVNAELEALLKKNNKCLRCHTRDKSKTLEDGQELSLQVHKEDYISSAHGEIACVSCHEAIGNKRHPSKKTNITIASQREYSIELNQACRNCHEENFVQYEGSIHSSMVSQGSDLAPVCTDCHSAHAIETMEHYEPATGLPCKNCHERIFNAYSESVHGEARINGNTIRDTHIQAPVCADCHQAHEVVPLGIGDSVRSTCIGCHENIELLHYQWLPNAGTHLDIVSCAVCHAPFAKHRFDVHLYDNETQVPVSQEESEVLIREQLKAIEKADGSADPLEFFNLMEASVKDIQGANISLRGRMEVISGIAAHQIASKDFAVRTCDSCHQDDRRAKQNVTVSIPGADGRVQRFDTDIEGMSSVSGMETVKSMSDFYALGGNKNKLLDIMFLLSLAAGIAIPIGHFTLGRMIKEKMHKGEQ